MESKDINQQEEMWQKWDKEHRRGKIAGGLLIVVIGSLFLIRELGVSIPEWIYSWKTLLIAIGLLTGIKHGFRNGIWLVFVLIGGAFLISDMYPTLFIKPLLWPVLVILFGLFIIFKPHRSHKHKYWKKWHKYNYQDKHRYFDSDYFTSEVNASQEDSIDFFSFMSGIKKNIVSKNFKGGEITVVFGSAKVNFSQADFNETVSLEVVQVFGGTQLIIPAHWEIKSEELVCVFGSVEDKRDIQPTTIDHNKVLILRGVIIMGGIEIKSY